MQTTYANDPKEPFDIDKMINLIESLAKPATRSLSRVLYMHPKLFKRMTKTVDLGLVDSPMTTEDIKFSTIYDCYIVLKEKTHDEDGNLIDFPQDEVQVLNINEDYLMPTLDPMSLMVDELHIQMKGHEYLSRPGRHYSPVFGVEEPKMQAKKVWLITDTHFNHQNLTKWGDRPEGFTEMILKNWEEMVGEDDITIHLGDVIMGRASELEGMMKRIKGKVILIKGNHDNNPDNWYLKRGFDEVYDHLLWEFNGKKVLLTHAPIRLDQLGSIGLDRDTCIANIHGHFHNNVHRSEDWCIQNVYDTKFHKLLAIENTDLKPVLLEEFLKQ